MHHLPDPQSADFPRQPCRRRRIVVQHVATVVAQALDDRGNQVPAAEIRLQARDQHAVLVEAHVGGGAMGGMEVVVIASGPILQRLPETPVAVAGVHLDVPQAGQRGSDRHAAKGRRRQVLLDLPNGFGGSTCFLSRRLPALLK